MTDANHAMRWWYCDEHAQGNHAAWGCPECCRDIRVELARLKREQAKLQTVAGQVLRDMQAQGVLLEWQTELALALDKV